MKKKLSESGFTLNLNLFPQSISQYFDGFLIKYPKLGYSFQCINDDPDYLQEHFRLE
jgi:hypothetical protein